MWLCLLATMISSCSKDNDNDGPQGQGSLECSYQVTLEGITTLPNEFGQDMVVISGADGVDDAEEHFAIQIVQSKGGASNESLSFTSFIKATLDRNLALGQYPVIAMVSGNFASTDTEMLPLYSNGELSDTETVDDMVFTLLENSDKRLRMKISGMAMKTDMVDGEIVELGKVPVEAEISIAADLLNEVVVEGINTIGAICECQDQ